MALLSNAHDRPFSLAFVQDDREMEVTAFHPQLTELYQHFDSPAFTIKENVNVSVKFFSEDPNAQLYMDGLESIPDSRVEENEEGEAFLSPSPLPIPLFKTEYFPLIPGVYRIKVKAYGRFYYTSFKVLPKHIDEKQLAVMRQELEGILKGLAMDFVRDYLSLNEGETTIKTIPPRLLVRFFAITTRFSSVIAALSDLYRKVNFRTKKEYRLVPLDHVKVIDGVSIRYRLQHPEDKEFLKAPHRTIDYDLPENRWVKRIINDVVHFLNAFSESLENYRKQILEEIEKLKPFAFQESTQYTIREKQSVLQLLHTYLEKAQQMKRGIQSVQSAPWYEEIFHSPPPTFPHVLTSDARYRALYQLYRELQQNEVNISFDRQFAVQWKRTDKLYEMWGFLTVLNLLAEKLGFTPTSGWLYDADFTEEGLLIPSLPEGTTIVLQKENIRLHLKYNETIPFRSKDTNMPWNPLYTTANHNRPDGRIDVYKDDIYKGSLLLEFKYRNHFWDPYRIDSYSRTKVMNQLIAYGNNCRSLYLFGEEKGKIWHELGVNPVREVWAVYPLKESQQQVIQTYSDQRVKVISMSPGHENNHIPAHLEQVITQIVNWDI
ncbi:hypothetical protein BSNK01_26260 [Bacillaceae bacterium]